MALFRSGRVFRGRSAEEALAGLLFEGAREEASKVKKRVLEKAAECRHERVELVEAHEDYQIGVCVSCRQLFRRERK